MDQITEQQREQIGAYLSRIVRTFEVGLHRLSGTGVCLPLSVREPLFLQRHQPERDRLSHFAATSYERLPEREELPPPVNDIEVLRGWVRERKQPLLVLAPFGAGKSVLLACFAMELAQQGLAALEHGHLPNCLPLPVRLREWVRFRRKYRQASFLTFLWAAQKHISDLPGKLSIETFKALHKRHLIVPFF
ncbi:MAG: hypothetical protein WCI73_12025, partial [Phycisphaerae bacterium]